MEVKRQLDIFPQSNLQKSIFYYSCFMNPITKILCLIMVFIISCQNRNDNNTKSISDEKKTEIANTALITKKEPDNYLLDNTSNQDNGPVYMYCEKMPEFIGGETAFTEFVKNNVKYPQQAVSDKIEGRVVIKFIVQVTGEISDVQLIRGIRKDLNDECIRVISRMPKWKPGMINGNPVSVSYSIPIRFLLNSTENLNGIYILPAKKNKR
jgi:periplasmic protein TonB